VLVDVSGVTDMHPNDVVAAVHRLVASGEFGVADAADGYLLLARGAPACAAPCAWPDAFYDFARARGRQPQHSLDVAFGSRVRLVGYDLVDDPRWRLTRLRLYWRASEPLPGDASIGCQVLAPSGAIADDTAIRPMPRCSGIHRTAGW